MTFLLVISVVFELIYRKAKKSTAASILDLKLGKYLKIFSILSLIYFGFFLIISSNKPINDFLFYFMGFIVLLSSIPLLLILYANNDKLKKFLNISLVLGICFFAFAFFMYYSQYNDMILFFLEFFLVMAFISLMVIVAVIFLNVEVEEINRFNIFSFKDGMQFLNKSINVAILLIVLTSLGFYQVQVTTPKASTINIGSDSTESATIFLLTQNHIESSYLKLQSLYKPYNSTIYRCKGCDLQESRQSLKFLNNTFILIYTSSRYFYSEARQAIVFDTLNGKVVFSTTVFDSYGIIVNDSIPYSYGFNYTSNSIVFQNIYNKSEFTYPLMNNPMKKVNIDYFWISSDLNHFAMDYENYRPGSYIYFNQLNKSSNKMINGSVLTANGTNFNYVNSNSDGSIMYFSLQLISNYNHNDLYSFNYTDAKLKKIASITFPNQEYVNSILMVNSKNSYFVTQYPFQIFSFKSNSLDLLQHSSSELLFGLSPSEFITVPTSGSKYSLMNYQYSNNQLKTQIKFYPGYNVNGLSFIVNNNQFLFLVGFNSLLGSIIVIAIVLDYIFITKRKLPQGICPQCRFQNQDEDIFCSNCGFKLQ